jgi:lysophospholipase L1-like esterase
MPAFQGKRQRQRGEILQGLVLVVASTCLTLGLAEGAVRLLLPPPERVTVLSVEDLDARLRRENDDPKKLGYKGAVNALFIKTPTGRRLRASTEVTIENHSLSHRTIVLRTNALGFRGPEIGPKTRPRTLFLGDSITMAHYLPEEETFVHLVGEALEASGSPVETVNAGVGGIGLETELAILRETGLRVDPDTVVLEFYLNDVQQSPGVRILPVASLFGWSALARYASSAVPRLLARDDWEIGADEMEGWRREIEARAPGGPGDPLVHPGAFNALVQENFRDWGSAWSDGAWSRIDPLLAEFRRQADLNHFRLVIVAFPVEPQVKAAFVSDWPQRRLQEAAAKLGLPVLDLLPALRAAAHRDSEPLFYDVCHHTPAGSRVVADAIARFLRTREPTTRGPAEGRATLPPPLP